VVAFTLSEERPWGIVDVPALPLCIADRSSGLARAVSDHGLAMDNHTELPHLGCE